MPTVKSGRATIYYESFGEGHPVFFIHGGGGNTLIWFQNLPYFSKHYRCIPIDLRCFHRSKCDDVDFHPRHFVPDVLAIMAQEEIESAAFVCQSLGAWAGLPLAVKHPERVSCLAISGSPTTAYSESNYQVLQKGIDIFVARRSKARSGSPPAGFARHFVQRQPELTFLYKQFDLLNGKPDIQTMADEELRLHPTDLKSFSTPTLIMGGLHDQFLTPENHKHVATLIPGAEVYTFPESGHSPYFEEPEHYNEVVDRFLSRFVPRVSDG